MNGNPLLEIVMREAARQPLTLARYMELALQHSDHGYYRRHDPLGRLGDFITAPEVSQIFGELIGLWCADIWRQLGRPESFVLLELGPGRGTLLADALRAARAVPGFIAAMRLHLLESNATLRARQAEVLAPYHPQWPEDIAAIPALPAIVIANEFFDALPIRLFVRAADGWQERRIGAHESGLCWVNTPPDAAVNLLLTPQQQSLPIGAVAEIAPQAQQIMRLCAGHIRQRRGAMLAIDYGYAAPQGENTFQAVSGHARADPLAAPGQADLTAHVDFGALAQAAAAAGARVETLKEQGDFLHALGLRRRAEMLMAHADEPVRNAVAAACARLTADEAMGKLFKVLCVTYPEALRPAGWEQD